MNLLLVLLICAPGSRLNTSFYTFHKIGTYSISDFYLDYGVRRYDFRFTLERRFSDFGLKSFGIEIDSLFGRHKLIIGEKPYYVNAPFSTTCNIWGLTLTSPDFDIFCGKTKDYVSQLPPTFDDNKYTVGVKLRRNLWYRIPLEFSLLRKRDNYNPRGILSNTSFGTNTEINLGQNLTLGSQIWTSLSDIGFGSSLALRSSYTGQKYGGHAYFRKVFRKYATPSNLVAEPGNNLKMNFYQKPNEWISFGQEISYSSFYDADVGLNTAITRQNLPDIGYGIGFARRTEIITQYLHAGWRYRKFNVAGDYTWSSAQQCFAFRANQEIKKFQIYSSIRFNDDVLWQIGGMVPLTPSLRLKNYFISAWENSYTKRTTGAELSFKLLGSFNANLTYEGIHYNGNDDHFVSFSVSNTLLFDDIGFSFVSGRVFMDLNDNGYFDVTDVAVSDIEVILDNAKSTRTADDGTYSFSFVKAGEHIVGLNFGSIPAEIGTKRRELPVDTKFLSTALADFSLEELGVIEGVVYYDDNKNNSMDFNETGVPNVVLALNGYSTTSTTNGRYRFANLPPGTYALEVKLLPPETMLATPEAAYITIKPGAKIPAYYVGVIKKERPVKKKVFGEVPSETIESYVIKARERMQQKDYAEAVQLWQKVLDYDPNHAEAKLAIADLQKKLYAVPSEVMPRVQMTPEQIDELFQRATIYFIAEMYEKALKIFDEVLAADPNHKSAQEYRMRTLARLRAQQGEQ